MLEKRLNGNQLKLIAVLSMLLDHIGYILRVGLEQEPGIATGNLLYDYARPVLLLTGRIAFPIFAYLLMEGFYHTRNRKNYILRVGIFGLISEIPFNLFLSGSPFYSGHQNVFLTFFLGLCMMAAIEAIRRHIFGEPGLMMQLAVVVAACGLAWILKTDYQYCGIMLIAIFYWFRENPRWQCLLGFIWQINFETGLLLRSGLLISFLLLFLYNGERGKRKIGYFFYIFYPVHLLVLNWITPLIFKL